MTDKVKDKGKDKYDIKDGLKNEEIELFLLSALLADPESYPTVAETISDTIFNQVSHRHIFKLIEDYYTKYGTVDGYAIAGSQQGEWRSIISDLTQNSVTGSLAVKGYVDVLNDLATKRNIFYGVTEVMDMFADQDESFNSDEFKDKLDSILQATESAQDVKAYNNNGIDEALKDIERAVKNQGVIGIQTGYTQLDGLLGGLGDSELGILAGRPGMGKTSLALGIADYVAHNYGNVYFASLEMSRSQLEQKRLAMHTGVPVWKQRQGKVTSAEYQKLVDASISRNLWIDDTPGIRMNVLKSRCKALQRKEGLALIVIDYLQLMNASKDARRQGTVASVTEISKGLKELAKECGVPVLALSQLSRAVENRDEKRPQLSDLRESGSIEQDADSVMFTYRDEYYLERMGEPKRRDRETTDSFNQRWDDYDVRLRESKGKAEVIVAKNRHGGIGIAHVGFEGELTRFYNL